MSPIHFRKLPAFTLVEVLIVIIISCFFVVMVYASVRFFLLTYVRDKAMQQVAGNLWSLEGSLLHETETSQFLYCSVPDSLLLCIMPSGDTIRYHFHRQYLLRSQASRIDTLAAGCAELTFSFNSRPVESGITDHIEMKTRYKQSIQLLQFDKTYSPEVMFTLADTLNRTAP
jgi:hypothetical protein